MEFILLILIIVLLAWFLSGIIIVNQKTQVVVEVFGKFASIKNSGLGYKYPSPIGRVAGRVNLKIQEVKDQVSVKTVDNAFLSFPVSVQFRVIENMAKEAFYELEDPVEQITSYILNLIRSKAASMTMNDLYVNKDDINAEVEKELKGTIQKFGYEIIRVLVDEPQPSKDVADAFNRVISAQREKEAAQAQADALRVKLVGQAQAEAESLELKAQAYVNQRKVLAEGIGEAMERLRSGLQNVSDREILDYFAGIDYRDTVRDSSKNEGTIIITPMNTGAVNDFSVMAGVTKGIIESK